MRLGICWVLGFVMIVAGVGNSDYGLSKVISAKLPIDKQSDQLNTIQPFTIVGEGIENIIHIEPIPGGKLLAQTPLSYRLVDPRTGKIETLPKGFPEGEITQWEEDYAVVRTIANQEKPVTNLYTLWPKMIRCLTPIKHICFTDKYGAYASFELEDNQKSALLKCHDNTGKLIWDKLIQLESSFGEYGILRVFDNKLLIGYGWNYKLMIFDLANGESITQGNSYHTLSDSYFRSNYAKPVKGGSFYVLENGLITPKTIGHPSDEPKFSATKEGYETAWIKNGELKYSYCTGNDGAALYTCSIDTKSLPCSEGEVKQLQNGVILVNYYDSCCYFLDVFTGKILDTINAANIHHLWSFIQDNTICMVANGNFHFFDTDAKKMRNVFSLPMHAIAFGQDTFGYTSSDKGGKIGFELFDITNPEKKAFVGVPFIGASCGRRGIITYPNIVKKGEILGHLNKYDGSMETLAYAETEIVIYWMGEYKGECYGLFAYYWCDLDQSMIAIAKLENRRWVWKIIISNQQYAPFSRQINNGKIVTLNRGSINVVYLDEMKEYSYAYPDFFGEGYVSSEFNNLLFDDFFVIAKSKGRNSPNFKCAILNLKTGKYFVLDKLIGYCNEYVLGINDGKYYKYINGTLEEIDEVKFAPDFNLDFFSSGYKLKTSGTWYTNHSARRDLEEIILEQSNGWTQSVPVTTYQYTSMPPELYPWYGFYTIYTKPNPSWLPKMKKCASYKMEINKAGNGEFDCTFEVKGANLLGKAWLVLFDESERITFLGKPRELIVKAEHKTTLSFPSSNMESGYPLALVVESNGFLDVQSTYEDEKAKSELPLFAGMQAGPSGENIVNAFFWEAPKGEMP